jgi:hypothetical protein
MPANLQGIVPCLGLYFSARAGGQNAGTIYGILSNTVPANSLDIGEFAIPSSATGVNPLCTTDASTFWVWAAVANDRINIIVRQ